MANQEAPALEMLWERTDPGIVLRERFGFDDARTAGRWVTTVLEERWGVRVAACERIVMSASNALAWVRTPSGRLLAKWSVAEDQFARLGGLAELTSWLDERGLPVSAPVAALDGRLQLPIGGVSLGVQREVTGELLDVGDLQLVRVAGSVLARLHDALSRYPTDDVMARTNSAAALGDRITTWLENAPGHLPADACDVLRGMVASMPGERLSSQLTHGDFRSANILRSGSEVTAVLDFEEACVDHRVVELARSAVLIGTRFHDWGPVPESTRVALLDGYQEVSGLTSIELAWWKPLLLWFSLCLTPPGDDPTGWRDSVAAQVTAM